MYFDCVTTGNVEGICAVKQSGGALLWQAITGTTDSAFSIANGVLYASDVRNVVLGLNAATGAPVWSSKAAVGKSAFSPAIARGAVYVSGTTTLSSFEATNGKQLWSQSLACAPQSSPSVANGVVYVVQGGNNCPAMSAFDARTGAPLLSLGTLVSSFQVSPVIANGIAYVPDTTCGSICAYGLRKQLREPFPRAFP